MLANSCANEANIHGQEILVNLIAILSILTVFMSIGRHVVLNLLNFIPPKFFCIWHKLS